MNFAAPQPVAMREQNDGGAHAKDFAVLHPCGFPTRVRKGVSVPPVTKQLMLPPMGLRENPIEQCPTMWFNVDFFERPWPDWKVDVDVSRRTTYFSHTTPGETIVGHPVRIKLEKPGIVWIATNRFCRMGGPFAEVLIEARWPD